MSSFFAARNTTASNAFENRVQLKQIYDLAHGGQVAHAVVLWHKHKQRHGGCVCEKALFDQKLCGFCLLSGLQTEALAQSCTRITDRFFNSAQTVSDYLTRRTRTHTAGMSIAAE